MSDLMFYFFATGFTVGGMLTGYGAAILTWRPFR